MPVLLLNFGVMFAEKLADAALQISAVYDLVFGGGFISRHLKVRCVGFGLQQVTANA